MVGESSAVRPGPLAGVRVIDATQALAGPFCTMTLADLGADVIKVEPPGGDRTRGARPFTTEDSERSYGGYFASVNRGKRSIVLDLKQPADCEIFLRLIDDADAVVENSRAGVMDRLGVGYEVLAARNPALVYGAIRGFGDPRTGGSPYVEWPCYDVVAQAMGGLVSITMTRLPHVGRLGDLFFAHGYSGQGVLIPALVGKVLSEAMAYGVVPIASAVSSIPQYLNRFSCGQVVGSRDPRLFGNAIEANLRAPALWEGQSKNALKAAQNFSYTNYLNAVRELLSLPFSAERECT